MGKKEDYYRQKTRDTEALIREISNRLRESKIHKMLVDPRDVDTEVFDKHRIRYSVHSRSDSCILLCFYRDASIPQYEPEEIDFSMSMRHLGR